MSELERVARALFDIRMYNTGALAEKHGPQKFPSYTWEEENNQYREHCLREARGVLLALPQVAASREWYEARRAFLALERADVRTSEEAKAAFNRLANAETALADAILTSQDGDRE